MISKLLVGTGNQKKLQEYKKFLSGLPIKLVSPWELKIAEPDESGKTLEENALLKAKHYCEKSGIPTIADDAGFEILALDNFPGVFSHRFEGHKMADEEIITKVLEKMDGLTGNGRKARMKVVIALALTPQDIHLSEAYIEGHVPEKPYDKIMPHFPYRSLLFVDSVNKWFYDLTGEEGESMDYRKVAIEQLKKYLS